MNTVMTREEMARATSDGVPFKSYIKTILGKVNITVWDVFQNIPVSILLEGDPRKNEDGSYIDFFSEYENSFFRKANKRHLELGNIIEYERPSEVNRKRSLEEFSDVELKEIINSPFLKLQNALNKTSSVALLFRFETLATELDKSDKVLTAIRSRLSEVQNEELPISSNTIEDEIV